jgi:hypothetical protein
MLEAAGSWKQDVTGYKNVMDSYARSLGSFLLSLLLGTGINISC